MLRGFTMIEMLTVIAIVGIIAGLSAFALRRLKARGNFSSATGDFITALRTCRAEAFARGDNTVLVIDTVGGNWWAIEDVAGTFSLAAFLPATPAPPPDRLIWSGTLPSGVIFGPSAGWGFALPAPLSGIPTGFLTLADGGGTANISTDGGTAQPNFKYCSFCDTSTGMGAITFLPSGGALFSAVSSAVPQTIGHQISMEDVGGLPDGGTGFGIIDFTVVGATGAAEAVTVR